MSCPSGKGRGSVPVIALHRAQLITSVARYLWSILYTGASVAFSRYQWSKHGLPPSFVFFLRVLRAGMCSCYLASCPWNTAMKTIFIYMSMRKVIPFGISGVGGSFREGGHAPPPPKPPSHLDHQLLIDKTPRDTSTYFILIHTYHRICMFGIFECQSPPFSSSRSYHHFPPSPPLVSGDSPRPARGYAYAMPYGRCGATA